MRRNFLNKFFVSLASISLLFNSLATPLFVYAQENPIPEPTPIETPTLEPTIEPTAEPTLVPTSVPTEEPTAIPTATATPTVILEPTPTQALSQWTFEKVELDKEYIDPENSGVKLTFTKLPTPAGNIKIEEITLTQEQIQQTGSLSDKAYDITSDMKDGDFTYNLSLPIPEASKGKAVEVKFAETVSDLPKISDVTEATQKEDGVIIVRGLSHFTVFIITGTTPPSASNIIDDGDANFSTNVTWNNYAAGINGDHKYIANTAGNWARWTFTDDQLPVTGKDYKISVHWVVWNDHVTNATYRLYDSSDKEITTFAAVDQNKKADGTIASNGTLSDWYTFVGESTLENGYYIQLETDGSNSRNIVADAIKIETASAPAEVWVNKSWSSQTVGADLGSYKVYGYNSFSTLQQAVAAVAENGNIHVAPEIYIEEGQIVINKNLSIVGDDKTTTIIKPNQNTGTSGDSRGWFLVNSGESFTLENVTLDGTGKNIHTGIRNLGNTTLTGNVIKNTSYPGYLGFAVNSNWEAAGDTLLTVKNNTFSGYGRVGVHVDRGSGTSMSLIDNNIFIGKGEGDHLDYAIEVEGGASATITNNDISNNKGIASSDGSTSAGILATTYFAPGTNITLTNNSIHDNSYGVALGYGSSDTTSVLQFDGNTFNSNNYDFDNYTVNNVDARNNTWSVADQNNLDLIEAKINHYCSGSTYVHGICKSDDYSTGGMVQYKNIGTLSNLGWNVRSKSSTPNETPLDLACPASTVYTNENSVAQNWSAVSGANIKYQREVTFPNSSVAFFNPGSNNNFTPFSSFGAGDEGQWGTRVRAYADANNNNVIDSGEEVSPWSNPCNITYDKTAPSIPGIPFTFTPTASPNQTWTWNPSTDIVSDILQYLWRVPGYKNGSVLSISADTNLPDGVWNFFVKAQDLAGNESGESSGSATVDTTPPENPTIVFSSHTREAWNSDRTIGISWSSIDGLTSVAGYSWKWDQIAGTIPDEIVDGNVNSNTSTSYPTSQSIWFHIRAVDSVGNWSGTTHYGPFWIDAANPQVAWVNPVGGDHIRGVVNLQITASDVGSGLNLVRFRYGIDVNHLKTIVEDTSFPYEASWNTSLVSDGSYILRARAIDDSGRSSSVAESDISVTVDNAAPTATITYSTTLPTNGSVVTTLHPSELVTITNNGGSDTYTFTDNGSFLFEFRDQAGNTGSATATVNNIDKTPPTIANLAVSKTYVKAGDVVTITADVSDASGVSVVSADFSYNTAYSNRPSPTSVGMTKVSSDTYQVNYTVPSSWHEGTVYIKVAAKDATGGNWVRSTEIKSVVVDNTKPTSEPISPIAGFYKASTWGGVISGTASDDRSGVNKVEVSIKIVTPDPVQTLYWDGDSWETGQSWLAASGTTSWTYTIATRIEGTYTFYSHATDDAGNLEATGELSGVIYDITPPQLSWTSPVKDTIISGTIVMLSVATDNLSGVASVTYSYQKGGEDSWHEIGSVTEKPYQINWDTTGLSLDTYTLRATATDNAGNETSIERTVGVAAVISGESGVGATYTSAVVTWTTDRPTSSRVVYDTVSHGSLDLSDPNYGYANSTGTGDTDPKVLSHSVTIDGLSAGTVYYYRTISAGSPTAVSDGQHTFATLSVAGAPAPGPWSGLVAGISTVANVPWTTGVYYPVLSESTTNPSATEEVKTEENKGVLGEETQVKENKKTWIWIITIALVCFIGFIYLRKRSKKS